MSGLKNFLLRGNLVDLAVAVIIATAFSTVIAAFTAWLMASLPATEETFSDVESGDFGFFLNAVIAFVVLATVIYFFVVVPYTRAREKYFPSPPPGTPEEVELLREIRDALLADRPTRGPDAG